MGINFTCFFLNVATRKFKTVLSMNRSALDVLTHSRDERSVKL